MNEDMTKKVTSEDGSLRRRVRYDRAPDEPPSVAVTTALARYYGEDVTTTSVRLYDYVDPDALDALFDRRHDGHPRSSGRVQFEVEDVTVVVRPDSVQVYPNT